MTEGKKRVRPLTAKQARFAQLVASGESKAEAYRRVFKPKSKDPQYHAEHGSRTARIPQVAAEIARLRALGDSKALLSLNDRLAILARNAQTKGKTPAHLNASTRAIDVYSKISGDQAPQRVEVTGKDGAPIPVGVTAVVTRMSVRDRLEMFKKAREATDPTPT